MERERIPVRVLAVRSIPNADPALAQQLGLPEDWRSIGVLTTDCDDVTYCALDEATKAAAVEVVYARSLYGGANCASTRLAGEVIGILAAENPSEITAGLQAAVNFISGHGFCKADPAGEMVYFAHTVSSTGSYLSQVAGVPKGDALAYLIAPPLESVLGLDAALKAADVELKLWFAPPSETNFGGGLLTGSQSACDAACKAFAETVIDVAGKEREV